MIDRDVRAKLAFQPDDQPRLEQAWAKCWEAIQTWGRAKRDRKVFEVVHMSAVVKRRLFEDYLAGGITSGMAERALATVKLSVLPVTDRPGLDGRMV